MLLIAKASTNDMHIDPQVNYCVIDISAADAAYYLRLIWDFYRVKLEQGHPNLDQMQHWGSPASYIIPFDIEEVPEFKSLVDARDEFTPHSLSYLVSESNAWLRLPDDIVLAPDGHEDEKLMLWHEADRTVVDGVGSNEAQYSGILFWARYKHADGDIRAESDEPLWIDTLQAIARGDVGKADPCVFCLWEDRAYGTPLCPGCLSQQSDETKQRLAERSRH